MRKLTSLFVLIVILTSCSDPSFEEGIAAANKGHWPLARQIMQNIVNKSGAANARTELAQMILSMGLEKNKEKAISLLEKAARQDFTLAQVRLGDLYSNGLYIKNDYAKAILWFRTAALRGDSNASYKLGNMYLKANGVKRGFKVAHSWFLKAAKNGHAQAQYMTHFLYNTGLGVKGDYLKIGYWALRSAEQGNIEAIDHIIKTYLNGQGLKIDRQQALKWALIRRYNMKSLMYIKKSLNVKEVAISVRMANKWINEHNLKTGNKRKPIEFK